MSITVPRWRAHAVVATLGAGGLLLVTNETLPFGLITVIANDVGRTESEIGFLVTGYALVVMGASVPLALLTRAIPRRHLLAATFGLWTVGVVAAALSDSYSTLLVARIITALAQAQYWAVSSATVAGMFPPAERGKAVSRMLVGPAAAAVVGLPTLTALGQQTTWQWSFVVLAIVGVTVSLCAAVFIPSYTPRDGAAARGSHPSARRFVTLMAITVLGVLGLMVVLTYITPYLVDVVGLAPATVPWVLAGQGAVGMVAMMLAGRFVDRYPRRIIAVGLMVILVAWCGLGSLAAVPWGAAVSFMAMGVGFSSLIAGLMNRALQLSPGSTDVGLATYSALYNTGIALGSWWGGRLLDGSGPHVLPWWGVGAVAAALVVAALTSRRQGLSRLTRIRRPGPRPPADR